MMVAVDERLAAINERIAAAADAWLTDPRDTGVYGRFVTAIEQRRAYLNPQLPSDPEPTGDEPAPAPPVTQDDELLDELAGSGATHSIGQLLAGASPEDVLARLRHE